MMSATPHTTPMRSLTRASGLAGVLIILLVAGALPHLHAREWNDPTGKFAIEARFVAADDELVVLETPDRELMIVQQDQLAAEDRQYIAELRKSGKRAAQEGRTTEDQTVTTSSEEQGTAGKANGTSTWHLRDGGIVGGRLLGFGSKTLVIERRRGDIFVNDQKLEELSSVHNRIVPEIISRIDDVPITSLEDLQQHLADHGGGPFEYLVEGIQLELESGGVVTLPLALLDREDAEQLAPAFERWKSAQGEDVPKNVKSRVQRRERLILDSYERLRRRQEARELRMEYLQLHLLAVQTGLIDIWQVVLRPPYRYGYPYTVLVPARNSAIAIQRAVQQYPGWVAVTARKFSDPF